MPSGANVLSPPQLLYGPTGGAVVAVSAQGCAQGGAGRGDVHVHMFST